HRLGQPFRDVVLIVGRHALQPADGDGFLLDPTPATGRLAGPVAGAAEDARKDIRLPIDDIGVGVAACGDQPDVFRDRRVRGTRPLTVYDSVKVVGIVDIRGS